MKKSLIIIAALVAGAFLAGCNAMNMATGAALNYTAANGAAMIQNIEAADDQAYIAWVKSACKLPIGALQRNATGNPGANVAALTACPVSGMGIVDVKNGNVTVTTVPTMSAPSPTAPYTAK